MQTLRDYQTDAVNALFTAWAKGESPIISVATGGGKTTIFAEAGRRLNQIMPTSRVLFVADTEELIYQMYDRVRYQMHPYSDIVGVVMAERNEAHKRYVVGTRQSLYPARLAKVLEHGPFDVVIIDECHGVSPGNSYETIVNTCRRANSDVRIAGFTATPKRTDRKALGTVFSTIAYHWGIAEGIDTGYLVPAIRHQVTTGVDLSDIKTTNGDYAEQALIERLTASDWVNLAVDAYFAHLHGKRRAVLAYLPRVEMGREFAEKVTARGGACAFVCGETPKEERREYVRAFTAGEIPLLVNVMVYTKGFDAPMTDGLLLARPTRSDTLFTQIVGRGLRPYPGKQDCLLIELGANDTKVIGRGSLLGRVTRCQSCGTDFPQGYTECPFCGHAVTRGLPLDTGARPDAPTFALAKGHKAGSIFGSRNAWYEKHGVLTCASDSGSFVVMPPSGADVTRQRERINRGVGMLDSVDPEIKTELVRQIKILQREIDRAEKYVLYFVPDLQSGKPPFVVYNEYDITNVLIYADRMNNDRAAKQAARWRGFMATDKQLDLIRRIAPKDYRPNLGRGEAGQIITHFFAVKTLEKHLATDYLPERTA